MSERDEQLAQFQVSFLVESELCRLSSSLQSITGCDADRAQFYLESANWQLDLAMASFYEGDGEEAGMDIGGGAAEPATAPAPAQSAAAPGGAGRINIVSGGQDDDEDDSDSEQQAFYAGGSTNSGNMVSQSVSCGTINTTQW